MQPLTSGCIGQVVLLLALCPRYLCSQLGVQSHLPGGTQLGVQRHLPSGTSVPPGQMLCTQSWALASSLVTSCLPVSKAHLSSSSIMPSLPSADLHCVNEGINSAHSPPTLPPPKQFVPQIQLVEEMASMSTQTPGCHCGPVSHFACLQELVQVLEGGVL